MRMGIQITDQVSTSQQEYPSGSNQFLRSERECPWVSLASKNLSKELTNQSQASEMKDTKIIAIECSLSYVTRTIICTSSSIKMVKRYFSRHYLFVLSEN